MAGSGDVVAKEAKALSAKWKALSPEELAPFKREHEELMAVWEAGRTGQ